MVIFSMSHLHDSDSLKTEKQIRCTFALTADQMLNVIVFECQYSDVASDTKVKNQCIKTFTASTRFKRVSSSQVLLLSWLTDDEQVWLLL